MDKSILDKQLEILDLLYRFRFLTSNQIQKLLHDKTPRLTNYHLKILLDNHHIGRHYARTLGSANQPAVYFLDSGCIKILEEKKQLTKVKLKRIYREKIRSQQFIQHALFIGDYYLKLALDSDKSNHTLHFFTKIDLEEHKYLIKPLPDVYFARVDQEKNIKRYIVDVIDEGSPRFAIRKRIDQYNDYVESGTFEEVTGHQFPTILFICPNPGIQIYLKKHIGRIIEETSLSDIAIFLATKEGAFAGHWEPIEAEDE